MGKRRDRADFQKERIRKRVQKAKRERLAQSRRLQTSKQKASKDFKRSGFSPAKREHDGFNSSKVRKEANQDDRVLCKRMKSWHTRSEAQEDDDMALQVDVVGFNERVDAPPKLRQAKARAPGGKGLKLLSVLEGSAVHPMEPPSGGPASVHGGMRNAAIEAYRKLKSKTNTSGRGKATMRSLKQLVEKGEEQRAPS
ncbi:unnamed protein product [Ostreobium quekettii]|uniref:Uncharacterized protein n=1 Tax=Ostreobium quekettii TaxID=121088 RepID=A0A8S1IU75_9CHLO|nr:unnamed protein product [Ostreobium quekettii]